MSVAAGGDDAGFGVEAMGAADVCAGFAVGFGGDAAGVDDDHIGLVGLVVVHTGIAEESGDGFAVGAGGATAEVFDVEGGWHRVSLAESGVRELAAVSRPLAELRVSRSVAFYPISVGGRENSVGFFLLREDKDDGEGCQNADPSEEKNAGVSEGADHRACDGADQEE